MDDKIVHPEDISLPPSPPPELENGTSEFNASQDEVTDILFQTPQRPVSQRLPINSNTLSTPVLSQPRSRSASSRNHLRSQSSTGMLALPLMQRAHSSPGVDSTGRFIVPTTSSIYRPPSPSGFSGRRRSPLRSAIEDTYSGTPSWSGLSIEPNIPEHAELDMTATSLQTLPTVSKLEASQMSPLTSFNNTFPRARRRPTSPLHQSASAPSLYPVGHPSAFASAGTSPILAANKYVSEPYPLSSFGSASSMPSTPTSLRSRSPSISSLETIPDTPDAEEAAMLQAEEMAKLRAAAGLDDNETKRSRGFGSKKERKRWSVCGAERRADFSLEPIEE